MTKPATEPSQSEKADKNIAHRTRNASRRDSSTQKDAAAAKKLEKDKKEKEKRQKPKSDFISPLDRRLGPYESLLYPPASTSNSMDPVAFEFRKFVGLIVKSSARSPGFTQEFVDELTDLSANYMNHLITLLHKYTEAQRHHKAGVSDLQMCLLSNDVTMSELYGEYERTVTLPAEIKRHAFALRDRLAGVLREYYAENYNLEKDDPSLVFHANEQYEIAALVPRQSEPRLYIPSYFPDLPPDFTYQNTGSYMDTITDLKQIKLKLVEESRLNEKSLYKLIEDDDKTWMANLEKDIHTLNTSDLDSDEEDIMSVSGDKNVTDVESPANELEKADGKETDEFNENLKSERENAILETKKPSDPIADKPEHPIDEEKGDKNDGPDDIGVVKSAENEEVAGVEENEVIEVVPVNQEATPGTKSDVRFDFVEYARKRRICKERELKQIGRRRRKRLRNIFMKAEQVFSAYATNAPSMKDLEYFNGYLEDAFRKVILATRIAETKKMEKLHKLQEEKALREQEQNQKNGSFEFGFAFNPTSNLLDDSDDEGGELQDIVFEDHEEVPKVLSNSQPAVQSATSITEDTKNPMDDGDAMNIDDGDDLGAQIENMLDEDAKSGDITDPSNWMATKEQEPGEELEDL